MNNWTVHALEALQKAQAKAYEMNHAELEPLHLLWALVSETGLAANTLRGLELDPQLIARTVDNELQSLPTGFSARGAQPGTRPAEAISGGRKTG